MADFHERLLLQQLLDQLAAARVEVRAGQVEGQERGARTDARLSEVQAAGVQICARLDGLTAALATAEIEHKALAARVSALESDRRLLRSLVALATGLAGWLGLDRLAGWVRGHP
jgi:chromosome condensin MukBEF ATPase and DNA-binding subunit MukB